MNPMSLFLIGAGAIVVIGAVSAAANKGLSGSRNGEADEAGEARRRLSGDASSTFPAGSAAAGLDPALYAPDGSPLPDAGDGFGRSAGGDAAYSSDTPSADSSGGAGGGTDGGSGGWNSGGGTDGGSGDFGGSGGSGFGGGGSFD